MASRDPYDPNSQRRQHHRRQESASYFHGSDPYRAVRKSSTPGTYANQHTKYNERRLSGSQESPGSSRTDALHSRSDSESSTSRLAPGGAHAIANNQLDAYNSYDYPEDDPYAGDGRKKKRRDHHQYRASLEAGRANSYLPYSHHRRDPYAQPEPIYVEEENLPSFTSPGGSLLRDNIPMDMVDQDNVARPVGTKTKSTPNLDPFPEIRKRKKKRLCGLRRRTIVFIVFVILAIIAVIWYFVWPRAPTMYYLQSNNQTSADWKETSVKAVWNISMRVDNSENWVPTHIKDLYFSMVDANTNKEIGTGSSGSLVLAPRKSRIVINVPINIDYSSSTQSDATLQDITACYPTEQNNGPETGTSMNVLFNVKYYIAGIAWTTTSVVRPNGFQCPPTS